MNTLRDSLRALKIRLLDMFFKVLGFIISIPFILIYLIAGQDSAQESETLTKEDKSNEM